MIDPTKFRVLSPDESYTFSRYFELPYPIQQVIADLGYQYRGETLQLPTDSGIESHIPSLRQVIDRNLKLVRPVAEITRREALVFPILAEVCDYLNVQLEGEYTVSVNQWLKGNLDYYIQGDHNSQLLVIEAKQSDLSKGFTQLAAELIAIAYQQPDIQTPFYGAVTTGDIWKFGKLDPENRTVTEDRTLYTIPEKLEILLKTLVRTLKPDENHHD
jgi:hypothetical protein